MRPPFTGIQANRKSRGHLFRASCRQRQSQFFHWIDPVLPRCPTRLQRLSPLHHRENHKSLSRNSPIPRCILNRRRGGSGPPLHHLRLYHRSDMHEHISSPASPKAPIQSIYLTKREFRYRFHLAGTVRCTVQVLPITTLRSTALVLPITNLRHTYILHMPSERRNLRQQCTRLLRKQV
ncbi:hypothetical protein EJ06DRAFT_253881 [Trichodelitschia bisporula]|uniref:Uncharacterized protein n=1 Tax=Trichodelitschia bisporula TaxID=703511 RepID=A0A6G1HJK9_9PEZI|nr:hypothetical protein EJ06DRAFT_253881 [Trichodelitschia bisporula]